MHYGWVVVAACLVVGLCGYGTYFAFTLFYAHLVAEFGWGRAAISGAMSLGLAVYGLFAFPMGWCADRFGPRPTVIVGGALFGVGTALGGAITELWHLYALYGGLSAAGMGAAWSPLVSTVSRWFDRKRGLAVGITVLGGGIGIFVIAPLTEFLIGQFGWRAAYLWLGAISGGSIVGSALLLVRTPADKGLAPYGASGRSTVPRTNIAATVAFVRDLRFWRMSLTFGLWWFAGAIVYVHIAPFMLEKGLDSRAAALVFTLFGVGNCLGRVAAGVLSDRMGALRVYRLTIGASAALMSAFALADGAPGLLVLSCALGFAAGGALTQFTTVAVALFGTASAGALMGAVLALVGLVGAGGPILSGAIHDASHSYAPAFHVGAAVFLLSLLLSIGLQRRDRRVA